MKKGLSNNIQNDLEENDYEAKRTFDSMIYIDQPTEYDRVLREWLER